MKKRISAPSDRWTSLRSRLRGERGFGIIEVCVSALMLALVSVGMFAAIDATTRSTAQARHRTQANSIAQADQARMRALPLDTLGTLSQTRVVTQDGNNYTVVSKAKFVTDTTGNTSCATSSTADYVQMNTTVTWSTLGSRPAVVAESVLTPSGDATSAARGGLAVTVQDSRAAGIPGVGIALSGAGVASGTTDSTGCVLLGNLPAGNYTLTPSAGTRVDKNGAAPAPVLTSVISGVTNNVTLQYDTPGAINVTFTTKVLGVLQASSADQIVAFNTGMTQAGVFGTLNTRNATRTATPLFPFVSPDSVYAGSCTGDLPSGSGGPALGSVQVPVGGTASVALQLPALVLYAWTGASPSKTGPISNAHVTVTDTNCSPVVKRTFATNSAGTLPDPGMPYSKYDICIDNGSKKFLFPGTSVNDMSNGVRLDAYFGSAGTSGTCP